MSRLFFLIAMTILCLLLGSMVRAENLIETGNIRDSQIVVFQGNQFDLGNEDQFKKFIDLLQLYPEVVKKLQDFFQARLDELDANNEERHLTLLRMLKDVQTAPQLAERLDKANAENQALHTRITELERKTSIDPDFKIVLGKAKKVLSDSDFRQYHIVLEEFTDLRKKQAERFHKEIGETAYLRADEYASRFDYNNAVKQMAEAVQYDPGNSNYWNQYGIFLSHVARFDKAIQAYNKALSIELKVLGDQGPKLANLAMLYNNLGSVWQSKGNYDKAIYFYNKALDITLESFGGQHSKLPILYNNLGTGWARRGDYDKAIYFYNKGIDLGLKLLGGQYPRLANFYTNLGEAWQEKGDYDKAIAFHNKALAIGLKILSDQHPDVATFYSNLGLAWGKKGDYDKAIYFYNKALAVDLKILSDEHPSLAILYNNLGVAWKKRETMTRLSSSTTRHWLSIRASALRKG